MFCVCRRRILALSFAATTPGCGGLEWPDDPVHEDDPHKTPPTDDSGIDPEDLIPEDGCDSTGAVCAVFRTHPFSDSARLTSVRISENGSRDLVGAKGTQLFATPGPLFVGVDDHEPIDRHSLDALSVCDITPFVGSDGTESVVVGRGEVDYPSPGILSALVRSDAADEFSDEQRLADFDAVIRSVAAGDFNANGENEIAIISGDNDSVSILDAQFETRTEFAAAQAPMDLALIRSGDFDDDGADDLVVLQQRDLPLGAVDASFILFHGSSTGEMSAGIQRELGGQITQARVLDIDGDGHLDLALLNLDEIGFDKLRFFVGDGEGDLSEIPHHTAFEPVVDFAFSDLSGDGRLDLVYTDWNSLDDWDSYGSLKVAPGTPDGYSEALELWRGPTIGGLTMAGDEGSPVVIFSALNHAVQLEPF